ncbi:hypothetical protein A3E44_04000 [Candidatus Woesebacteria bacterium RIFCSPHIGHO2_12_FULL_41_24]|uniref:Ribbon-helix-helix protein CopG domain-containing protein n=1 Tax=Candidatus Woesebacteria bacterium RIFCSPHIGHO2_12_FULL_41_24 TaxID=1802510 RepID=A0A1F8AV07_9BACT|nr:MAG: hypothetical protein A2W15_01490 [Candidatus Woesebacteria bacterium RBG_16_41_13]OGM55055.1 MAG: hypothetical protein A3E44_04000 [Candidatus Woesebacteria bacterium RIFCSPHIGHO2_12_FULL_41_24]OGM65846.1 MAG: hypothetical protein A2969_01115 [Candidatus Woesebacteria bacterium RIFCSPLOWO2_01_FULL_42_67]OGM71919.1 MAG: hypothetical protein A3I55_02020 [Candidatus Woesebacteria bacterium RIFCSPLOWO2_02_FULL_42_10]OGM74021.1 MAG: hypothetical protein A3H21_04925 [Candidatus Woesebacteria 
MANLRTTIVLPEEDVKYIKVLAATYGLTMSQVIQKSIRRAGDVLDEKPSTKQKTSGWRSVAGSLRLGGKEPSSRQEMYDEHIKRKLSA